MSIGMNIKLLRESKNMTQAEFGKIAGVSDKAVSTWENGTAEPRMGAIQKIADYFRIPKGVIIDDESPSGAADTLFIEKYGQPVYDAAMKYGTLDREDQSRIDERMDTMLESDKYKRAFEHGEKAI